MCNRTNVLREKKNYNGYLEIVDISSFRAKIKIYETYDTTKHCNAL